MKRFFFFLFLLIAFQAKSQIVNIESLRFVSDTSRWSGNANLSFSLIKNKNRILNFGNKIHVQYLYKKNLVLFVNKINAKEVNDNTLISRGIQHLRYNYKFKPRVAGEVFAQSQYDLISEIDFRGLLGVGPRFKLSKSGLYNFYIGVLSMYEYERIHSNLEDTTHRNIRNSTYFSFSLFPQNNIAIVSTTYFQPLYSQLEDFRVSNDTTIAINLMKRLSLNIGFTYLYDRYPALGVPKEQYKIMNGLTYAF